MSDELDTAIDLYLEGRLTVEQATQLEEQLAKPDAGRILSQELLLRDFLHTMSPDAPPAGLVEHLQATLPDAVGAKAPGKKSRWRTMWAVLRGTSVAAHGLASAARVPLFALGEPAPKRSVRSKVLRFGASSVANALTGKRPPPKPLWRRAVGWMI